MPSGTLISPSTRSSRSASTASSPTAIPGPALPAPTTRMRRAERITTSLRKRRLDKRFGFYRIDCGLPNCQRVFSRHVPVPDCIRPYNDNMPRQKGNPDEVRFAHAHRRHSHDSVTDPFELLKAAAFAGLDGVVITEHDYLWPESELEELRAAAPDLVVLGGVEITARGGDMLVYGATDPFALPRGIAWPELCREVHRQGGVAVAAHPNRWGQPFERILREQKPELDGIEVMSNNMDPDLRRRAADLLVKYPHFAQRQQRLARPRDRRLLLHRVRLQYSYERRLGRRDTGRKGRRR